MLKTLLRFCTCVLICILVNFVVAKKTCDPQTEYCVELNKCRQLEEELQQGNKSIKHPVYSKLKDLQCGYNGTMPKVCCPSSNGIEDHPNINLLPTQCGTVAVDYIFNGEATGVFDFGWMALLKYERDEDVSYECGGTFINDRYVLTAAHCITNLGSKRLTHVRVGEHNLKKDPDCLTYLGRESCAQAIEDIPIELVIPHENYNYQYIPYTNDIGLLRLKSPVNRELFEPVCLPISSETISKSLFNETALITGWGTTENGTTSDILLQARIPVVSNQECGEIFRRSIQGGIRDTHVCAGGKDGMLACKGDSGGPLKFKFSLNSQIKYIQFGIVSFGPQCGANIPGIYTLIPPYMNWILDKIKP